MASIEAGGAKPRLSSPPVPDPPPVRAGVGPVSYTAVVGEKRLILGRAGAGKTRRLLDRLAAAIAAGNPARTLLLVPTLSQASHLKRLLLSRYPDLRGFFDESLVTFTSLAERFSPELPIRDLLSGRRQDLLVRRVLADPPPLFARLVGYPGFRSAALAFVKELKQNGRPAAEVGERLEAIAAETSGAARERLLAFRSLFLAYERAREEEGLLDHEDYLRRARDRLRDGVSEFAVDFVGVDGFQNFTGLERDLLLLLAGRAAELEVTLPFDPALAAEGGRPFAVSRETREFLRGRGFAEVLLPGNRRAATEDLRRLERGLFAPDPEPAPPDGSVRALAGADAEDEADRVARLVLSLVTEGEAPYAWRDVVIVVRDTAVRRDLFRHAFRRHRIPLRIYGRERLADHPLVRAVRDLLAILRDGPERSRVLGLFRSGRVADVSPAAADRLEFDLLEHGPPASREDWIARVRPHSDAAADWLAGALGSDLLAGTRPPRELAEAVLGFLRSALGPIPDPAGDEEDVRLEALAAGAIRRLARETAEGLGPSPAAAPGDWLARFEEGLRELSAAPRDRRLDVVNLIDAREARQWEAPVVIVSGLVEGEFPRSPREDIFLAEKDRRAVNDRGDLSLRERALEREEESYLFYVALTRARERLWLTWPATDGKGEETLPSLFLREALALFPDGGEGIVSLRRLSEALPREEETADREDLRRRALFGMSEPYRPGTEEEARAKAATALHDLLVGAEGDEPDADYVRAVRVGARFYRPPAGILVAPEGVLGSPAAEGAFAVSALEDFAACPYLHFARRSLRLKGPPASGEDGLDPRLLGEIGHEVLERLFARTVEGGPLPAPEDVPPLYEEVFDRRAAGVPFGLAAERARRSYRRALVRLVAEERERLVASGWRPARVESDFEFALPGPEPLRVKGRVDRIDTGEDGGAIVIDYKGAKGFDRSLERKAEAGVHLQLPLYLLAAREQYGFEPAGAWLLPIRGDDRHRPSGYAVEGAPAPRRKVALGREELDALLERTAERVREIAARIRAGKIDVAPFDPDDCARCEYADLCRIEPWMAPAAEGEDGE